MPVVGDTRDLRDPQKLGELLFKQRETCSSSFSAIADWAAIEVIPDVTHDDSMGKQCVRDYRAELEARKEEGDVYAEAALRDIDAGKGVQGFDDAGA